jgi:predicted nucleic acid-binding protein
LPWFSLLAFARVVTNHRLFSQPKAVPEAWTQILDWLGNENAWIPQPTTRHADVLGTLMALPGISSALVSDAHLAALAIEHGLTLCSADGDFARFPGLRWYNPLIA